MSVSIFDIALIVDEIGESLPLSDIRSCRLVNRHFSSMFKSFLWRHQTLNAIIPTLPDEMITGLLDNKHWIRSLTIGAPHIEKASTLGFSQLQEVVLYDRNFDYAISGERIPLNIIDSLLDSNKELQSLEIDLDRYMYDVRDYAFSLTLMLAIARHPTLKRLVWRVPQGHMDANFAQYLLAVCHERQIRELHVEKRRHFWLNCPSCKGPCEDDYGCNRNFSKDIKCLQGNPELEALQDWLDVSIEDLGVGYAFEKLGLPFPFQAKYNHVVSHSPYLQEVRFELLPDQTRITVLGSLANCQSLRTLDLKQTRSDKFDHIDASLFQRLQTLRLPRFSKWTLRDILTIFPRSSRNTLEVLEMGDVITGAEVIALFETFPKLRELAFQTIRIYAHEDKASGSGLYTPGADDSTLEACIVQDYHPQARYYQSSVIEWSKYWNRAKDHIRDISAAYLKRRETSPLRPIYMQFVFPIKMFMSEKETLAYMKGTDAWIGAARRPLTLEDAKRMEDDTRRESEKLRAEYRRAEEERNQESKRRRMESGFERTEREM